MTISTCAMTGFIQTQLRKFTEECQTKHRNNAETGHDNSHLICRATNHVLVIDVVHAHIIEGNAQVIYRNCPVECKSPRNVHDRCDILRVVSQIKTMSDV